MKRHKVFGALLICNLVIVLPSFSAGVLLLFSVLLGINLLTSTIMFPGWWETINLIYGTVFSIPAIIIICFSTLFIIIKDYKQKNLTKKNLVMLLISCLLTVAALLCSFGTGMIFLSA
ncbi:MAG: hypothetical protein HDR22_02480 [Lachnospiraceae bacterium]|nr:hypothetical protein [Lachnospiraceae bacterium]